MSAVWRASRTRPPTVRRARLFAVAFVVALAVVVPAAPASAHAVLLETQPGGGATLAQAPEAVTIRFNEPVSVELGGVRIFDSSGTRLDTSKPQKSRDGTTVTVPLGELADDGYVVAWRVVSTDAHPIRGAFTFQVGEGTPAVGNTQDLANRLAASGGTSDSVSTLFGVARFGVFAGMSLLVGGFAFLWLVWPVGAKSRSVARLLRAAWGVTLVSTLAGIVLQGPYASGVPLADGFKPSLLGDVLGTRFGTVWALRIGLLLVAVPLLLVLGRNEARLPAAPVRWAAAAVGATILLTPGLSGHASSGDLKALALAADVVHLGAVAFWLGGLTLLWVAVLPGRDTTTMTTVVPRFSRMAFGAILVIVATGVFQSWRQVRYKDALTDTDYGKLLLVKVVAVTVTIGLAALSRSVVQRRLRLPAGAQPRLAAGPGAMRADPDQETASRLRRSVLGEVLVAVVVLGVTAVLVNTVPAREALAQPFTASLESKDLTIEVTIDPARVGHNAMHVYAFNAKGAPQGLPELGATIALPKQDVGPLKIKLDPVFPGHWMADGPHIPLAGTWKLEFTARLTEFDQTRLSTTFDVR